MITRTLATALGLCAPEKYPDPEPVPARSFSHHGRGSKKVKNRRFYHNRRSKGRGAICCLPGVVVFDPAITNPPRHPDVIGEYMVEALLKRERKAKRKPAP